MDVGKWQEVSNFARFFVQNFERIGLKKLISTSHTRVFLAPFHPFTLSPFHPFTARRRNTLIPVVGHGPKMVYCQSKGGEGICVVSSYMPPPRKKVCMSVQSYRAESIARRFSAFSAGQDGRGGVFRVKDRCKDELKQFIRDLSVARQSVSSCRLAYSK